MGTGRGGPQGESVGEGKAVTRSYRRAGLGNVGSDCRYWAKGSQITLLANFEGGSKFWKGGSKFWKRFVRSVRHPAASAAEAISMLPGQLVRWMIADRHTAGEALHGSFRRTVPGCLLAAWVWLLDGCHEQVLADGPARAVEDPGEPI